MKVGILLLLCILLNGCLVGPNYHPPQENICDAWSSEIPEELYCEPPVAWWQLFNDPLLDSYIERAAHCNNDILKAETNILQARALKTVTASALFPHVGADVNAIRAYLSKNGLLEVLGMGEANAAHSPRKVPQFLNLYNALLDATWEIDLFGKTRRAVESAEAQIGSAIEQKNDILISIFAEVAINYIELRSNQWKGRLVEENITLLEKNAFIARKRLEAGYISRLDLDRIEAEMAQAQANLPAICAQIYQNIYALSVLIGAVPETLLCELLPLQPLPQIPETLALGCRSDLLRRRPDVRKAERQLAAATANIGVAVASFFPSLTLGGVLGFQSLRFHNLFQAQSLTWIVGGDIHAPLFQGGNLIGNLHIAESQEAATVYQYQKTVLNALEEAESALIAYTEELKRAQHLNSAADRYRNLILLTEKRYTEGLVSLTDLLDSERQWNQSEQNLLSSETAALIDLVFLYKSLGGGWE